MTSHERYGVLNNQHLDILFSSFAKATATKTTKHPITGLFEGCDWISPPKGQLNEAENIECVDAIFEWGHRIPILLLHVNKRITQAVCMQKLKKKWYIIAVWKSKLFSYLFMVACISWSTHKKTLFVYRQLIVMLHKGVYNVMLFSTVMASVMAYVKIPHRICTRLCCALLCLRYIIRSFWINADNFPK